MLLRPIAAALIAIAAPTPLPRTVPLFTTTQSAPTLLPAAFDGRVLLQADVNGHSLWFHLDTGSPSLYVGAQDAKTAGLSADATSGYSQPVPVSIGAVSAPAARFRVLPSYGFELNGRRVAGLIGGPLFHANVITIDYPNRRVIFYPSGSFSAPAGAHVAQVDLEGNVPVVDLTVGATRGRFFLDTGSSTTELSSDFAQKVKLGPYRGSVVVGERREISLDSIYEVSEINLANFIIPRPQVAVSTSNPFGLDGILGRDILSRFAVTLDYPNYLAYFSN
jgi:hypothetical protein